MTNICVSEVCHDLFKYSYSPTCFNIRKTSCCKISQSLEAARAVFKVVRSLWNLTGTSAALLPKCLSKFKATRTSYLPISRLLMIRRLIGYWNGAQVVNRPSKLTSYCLAWKKSDRYSADETFTCNFYLCSFLMVQLKKSDEYGSVLVSHRYTLGPHTIGFGDYTDLLWWK